MHIGGADDPRRPAADRWRSSSSRSGGACTWSRATGTSSPTPRSTAAGPVWIDDPSFNLEYHIRHTALPAPGRWEQLQDLTARIFSQQLDRSKPLWEMWLIEGLEEDRFALITKTHHSLIDGIAGVDLATVLFDLSPDPPPITHPSAPVAAASRARRRAPARRGPARRGARRRRAGRGRDRRARAPRARPVAGPRGGRGRRRDRVGGPEPGARDAAERPDRAAPAIRRRRQPAGGLQARQGRLRRHGQRRRARRRGGRAADVPDLARAAHRGRRAARAGAGVGAQPGRAPDGRQPHRRDARPAAGLHRPTRSTACASYPRRWTGSRSPSRRSAPR